MTERPILFSAPMVRAILDGRKTMTRRVLKPQPQEDIGLWLAERKPARWTRGDRLWVREGFALVGTTDPGFLLYRANGYEAECNRHGFDRPYPPESKVRWRSPIHMPRWASRITLLVTDVRVERLQDISEADAMAEGMVWRATTPEDIAKDHEYCKNVGIQPRQYLYDGAWLAPDVDRPNNGPWGTTAREAFRALWTHLHGPDAWERNDWVSVTKFERVT